ncbi:MAG: CHAP domain-containing protein [Anaerolineae bacterium]|nr:CHAP domain-containing protein [Anaerolineae bacterium]
MLEKSYRKVTRTLSVVLLSCTLLLAQPAGIAQVAEAALPPTEAGEQAAQMEADAPPAVQVEVPGRNPYSDRRQCTYRAWELAAEAGHRLPKFGNAANWRQGALDAGYTVSDLLTPECVNSVAVWQRGVGGASWAGHVAWVTEVRGDQFRIQERNWSWARDTERWVTWQKGISFIVFKEEAPPPPPAQSEPPATAPATLAEQAPPRILGGAAIGGQALTLQAMIAGQGWGSGWSLLSRSGERLPLRPQA